MTETVLDLGAGDNPDPRATDTHDIRESEDHDHQFDLEQDWPLPANSVDGLISNHCLEHLTNITHFFHEAGRVLVDGGWLEVTVPLGEDAQTDTDHEFHGCWSYTTPELYCRENQRGWDSASPFVLVDRDLDVGFLPPFSILSVGLQLLARRWPNIAAYRCGRGELTATYRRTES